MNKKFEDKIVNVINRVLRLCFFTFQFPPPLLHGLSPPPFDHFLSLGLLLCIVAQGLGVTPVHEGLLVTHLSLLVLVILKEKKF